MVLVLDVHHGEAALFVTCAQLGRVHLDAGRHAVEAMVCFDMQGIGASTWVTSG